MHQALHYGAVALHVLVLLVFLVSCGTAGLYGKNDGVMVGFICVALIAFMVNAAFLVFLPGV